MARRRSYRPKSHARGTTPGLTRCSKPIQGLAGRRPLSANPTCSHCYKHRRARRYTGKTVASARALRAETPKGQCTYCEALLTGKRRVHCGGEDCLRDYNRDHSADRRASLRGHGYWVGGRWVRAEAQSSGEEARHG
jgi:hypothetical protein